MMWGSASPARTGASVSAAPGSAGLPRRAPMAAASAATLLAAWFVASALAPRDYLPSPVVVAGALAENLRDPESYHHIMASLRRMFGGFLLALLGGTVLGILTGASRRAEYLCDGWITMGLGVPSLCWAFVALMLFGLREAGVYFAVFCIVLPFVAVNVFQGVRALDTGLVQMAQAFRLAPRAVLRHVVMPQLVPFLFGATRYGLGLAWKATAVAELVSQQDGVGYIFGKWFGLFQMPQVLAWTATFVPLMLATEVGVVRPLEAGLTRWRREVRL